MTWPTPLGAEWTHSDGASWRVDEPPLLAAASLRRRARDAGWRGGCAWSMRAGSARMRS